MLAMQFDWRYGFHAFWLYLTFMILFSAAYYFTTTQPLQTAVGVVVALGVMDALFMHHYPYFSRVNRQGASAFISLAFFGILALLALTFNPTWPQGIWDLLSFAVAGVGGSYDGFAAHKTKILPYQTRRDLIRKAQILRKPMER